MARENESSRNWGATVWPLVTGLAVGFLVGETPRIVSLAQEILPDDDGFRAVTHIPVAIIERVVPLAAS